MAAALVVACAAGVAACGGGDAGRNAAAAAVSQTFLNLKTPVQTMTTSQAACFGTGVVNAFGVAQATKYGFMTADHKPVDHLSLTLSPRDAGTFADLYLSCADPAPGIKNALITQIAPRTATAKQQLTSCLDKNLTRALMRKALVAAASGDRADATLTPIFTACGRWG